MQRDKVEREYEIAIQKAIYHDDNDLAQYYATGLKEYQESFKWTLIEEEHNDRGTQSRDERNL